MICLSFHSFRHGTGKSTLAANMTALFAAAGQRVGVADMDLQMPGLHALFGREDERPTCTFNDYLQNGCSLADIARRIAPPAGPPLAGEIWLMPASTDLQAIAAGSTFPIDADRLRADLRGLATALELHLLILDTSAGLNDLSLAAAALADTLVLILRPDRQDYQGTALLIELARRLAVPRTVLIANEVSAAYDPEAVRRRMAETFRCEVVAALPHCDDLALLAGGELFVCRYPVHPLTTQLRQIAAQFTK